MKFREEQLEKSEVWKDVKGFEGLYEVSCRGMVRGMKRQGTHGGVLRPHLSTKGYMLVDLCKDGKAKSFLLHRLVAEAFLENPKQLPCINHKDEDKLNNFVENLEWCNQSYNNSYGTVRERRAKTRGRPCKGVWPDGTTKIYENCADAGRDLGLSQGSIWGCCNGRWKTSGGAKWSYI